MHVVVLDHVQYVFTHNKHMIISRIVHILPRLNIDVFILTSLPYLFFSALHECSGIMVHFEVERETSSSRFTRPGSLADNHLT